MNRIDKRNKKQAEAYKNTYAELQKLKQDYKDLKAQCAQSDGENSRLVEENTKLVDLVQALGGETSELKQQISLLSQAAEHAKVQGQKELESVEEPTP